MPFLKCSGFIAPGAPSCNNEVPFFVHHDSIKFQQANAPGLHQAVISINFSVTEAISEILALPGLMASPRDDKLKIHNLCKKCWDTKCIFWGREGRTLENGRLIGAGPDMRDCDARGWEGGIFFNCNKYWNNADIQSTIKSTMVHEIVHWLVFEGARGFQELTAPIWDLNWDEAVTDRIARLAYKSLGHGSYMTNYGRLSEFLEITIDKQVISMSYSEKQKIAEGENIIRKELALDENYPIFFENKMLPAAAKVIKEKIWKSLLYRYFHAPNIVHAEFHLQTVDFNKFIENTIYHKPNRSDVKYPELVIYH